MLRYGKARNPLENFLDIVCAGDDSGSDGARISGFRLFGPSFGYQTTNEQGVHIEGCHDVEISNMEIAGWGGAAIDIGNSAAGPQSAEPSQIHILIQIISSTTTSIRQTGSFSRMP